MVLSSVILPLRIYRPLESILEVLFEKMRFFLYGGSSFMCRNLYFALYLGFVFYVQIGIALFSSLMGLFRTKGCPLVCLYSYVLKNAPGAFKRKIWRNIFFFVKISQKHLTFGPKCQIVGRASNRLLILWKKLVI